jgi:hypothetical protein
MARAALFLAILIECAAPPAPSLIGAPPPPRHSGAGQAGSPPRAAVLDFEFFKARVQPILLKKRKGLARCYVCHSQGTLFRLQRLSPGSSTWNEAESRLNFDAARRFAVPGDPMESRLLTMPLVAEAGGIPFHPGGKHWTSKEDPEWKTLSEWVLGGR